MGRGSPPPERRYSPVVVTEDENAAAVATLERALKRIPLPDALADRGCRHCGVGEFRADRVEVIAATHRVVWFVHMPSGRELGLMGDALVVPWEGRLGLKAMGTYSMPCDRAAWKEPPAPPPGPPAPWRWKDDLPPPTFVAKFQGPKRRPRD